MVSLTDASLPSCVTRYGKSSPSDAPEKLKRLLSHATKLMGCGIVLAISGCKPAVSRDKCWSTKEIRVALNKAVVDIPAAMIPFAMAKGTNPGSPLPGLHSFPADPRNLSAPKLHFCQDHDHVPIRADSVAIGWRHHSSRPAFTAGVTSVTLSKLPERTYGRPPRDIAFPLIRADRKIDGDKHFIVYKDSLGQQYRTTCTAGDESPADTLYGVCVLFTTTNNIAVDTVVYTNLSDAAELPALIATEHAEIEKWIR